MPMNKSLTPIALLFIANNLLWLGVVWQPWSHSAIQPITTSVEEINNPRAQAKCVGYSDTQPAESPIPSANQRAIQLYPPKQQNPDIPLATSKPLDNVQAPIAPSEHSRQQQDALVATLLESDEPKKIAMVEALTAQGDDLALLDKILTIEDNPAVKITAINRLQLEPSEATIPLLLKALDDPAPEVSLIALNALASQGNETLLPILIEKMRGLPEGPIRDFYGESIQRLDMRVTMGLSNLTQQ